MLKFQEKLNFFRPSAAMQLLSPRLKLWFRLKLQKNVILGPSPHISGKGTRCT